MNVPDITMVKSAIHNPDEPRHFMRLKPVKRVVRIIRDGVVLAESRNALQVQEIGHDVYDPVFYLPRADIIAFLRKTERASHCPLKGEAEYFDLLDEKGTKISPQIAWSYSTPIDIAAALAGRIAFYSEQVTIEDAPV